MNDIFRQDAINRSRITRYTESRERNKETAQQGTSFDKVNCIYVLRFMLFYDLLETVAIVDRSL